MKKIMIVSAMLGCLVLAACKSAPKQTYYDPTFDEAESDSNEAAGETAASFEDQPGEIISVPHVRLPDRGLSCSRHTLSHQGYAQ